MGIRKLELWDWVGIALSPIAAGVLWFLVRSSEAADYAAWVALGPVVVGIVALATALLVAPPSTVMRISAPLAIIANVENVCSLLYYPRGSTAALGFLIAPANGVLALLIILLVVWVADRLYRRVRKPSLGSARE